jgi:hypothetical protein
MQAEVSVGRQLCSAVVPGTMDRVGTRRLSAMAGSGYGRPEPGQDGRS